MVDYVWINQEVAQKYLDRGPIHFYLWGFLVVMACDVPGEELKVGEFWATARDLAQECHCGRLRAWLFLRRAKHEGDIELVRKEADGEHVYRIADYIAATPDLDAWSSEEDFSA